MYLQKHQIIHFICDLYRNQREIFAITKKAAGREALGNVVKKVMGKAGLMVISLTIHYGEVVPQTFTIMGCQNKQFKKLLVLGQ